MKILALYYFLFYLALSAFSPYTSLYFSEKGFSSTTIGMILSLWALVSVISQPIMGLLSDRLKDPRKILMLCSIVSPILGLGFYYFNSLAAIIAVSVVFSWFQSSFGSLSDSLTVSIGNREGYSFSSIRLWGALSYALGAFITGFMYEKYGYDNIFFTFLTINALVLFTLFLFPRTQASHEKISVFEQAKEVFRNKSFIIFLGISLLTIMSTTVSMTFLPLYFKEMDFDKSWLGSAFAIAAIVEVPMFWLSIRLSKKIGKFNVLCIAAAIYAIKCLLLFAFHNIYLTLAVQILDGISFAFATGTSVEVVDNFASDRTKATFQTVFVAVTWGLSGIIGNAAGGVIIDKMGAPFLYLILFILSAFAAVLFAATRRMHN